MLTARGLSFLASDGTFVARSEKTHYSAQVPLLRRGWGEMFERLSSWRNISSHTAQPGCHMIYCGWVFVVTKNFINADSYINRITLQAYQSDTLCLLSRSWNTWRRCREDSNQQRALGLCDMTDKLRWTPRASKECEEYGFDQSLECKNGHKQRASSYVSGRRRSWNWTECGPLIVIT